MHSKRCRMIRGRIFNIRFSFHIYIYILFVRYNCRIINTHKYFQFRCIFHKCLLHLSKIDIQPFSSIFLNIYEYIDRERETHKFDNLSSRQCKKTFIFRNIKIYFRVRFDSKIVLLKFFPVAKYVKRRRKCLVRDIDRATTLIIHVTITREHVSGFEGSTWQKNIARKNVARSSKSHARRIS